LSQSPRRSTACSSTSPCAACGSLTGCHATWQQPWQPAVDPDDLLEVLKRETDADVELIALSGEPITRTAAGVERSWSGALTASVATAGVTVATLVLYPRLIGELLMLDAVRDRAPEALGIALLRSRALSHLERYLARLPVPGDRKHIGWLPRDRALL
jgi:hypothetical protein